MLAGKIKGATMNLEDATALLIRWLRNPDHGNFSSYGYDFYLPALIRTYLRSQGIQNQEEANKLRELCPVFWAAAWDLCRRGIVRPGINKFGAQATDDGNAGNGYSITPFGTNWLEESDQDDFIPTEPGRFAEMLTPYRDKFGPGFYERAQEAIRCYGAHAYLSCCAMCGASAESIILATAIAKDEKENILKIYNSARGRSNIENILIGKARKQIQNEYKGFTSLLKYWRDEAAHGHASEIKDNEAYTSLALLLRFASFVSDNWNELIGN
jgi:hypothetical protein